jgi:hypothetical protein
VLKTLINTAPCFYKVTIRRGRYDRVVYFATEW